MTIPKAIFFDLDGTLLSRGKMLESSKEALAYARQKGAKLFVATGRQPAEIAKMEWYNDVFFDGFVAMNGTYCYMGDKIIYKKTVKKDAVRMVVDFITTTPAYCIFCESDEWYITTNDAKVQAQWTSMGFSTPSISTTLRALQAEIFQMIGHGKPLKDFALSHPHLAITSWGEDCFDIIPAGASKWDGILHMLPHFGLSPSEVAAVGDGHNDIEMLTNAPFSVAMGNATDEIKACAKHVARHVNNGGALDAVKYLLG